MNADRRSGAGREGHAGADRHRAAACRAIQHRLQRHRRYLRPRPRYRVATGMATQIGKIAGMLDAVPETQTPLQGRLTSFGRQLALAILAICAVVFAAGIWRGEPVLLMLLTALSLAVAAIPEA